MHHLLPQVGDLLFLVLLQLVCLLGRVLEPLVVAGLIAAGVVVEQLVPGDPQLALASIASILSCIPEKAGRFKKL